MARLTKENVERARATIALYPQARSALLPVLHLLQEQDGYLTEDGMTHVAELIGITPAEVYGTATFYDMFFTHPVGTYLVSVCTNIACLLNGGYEQLEHAVARLAIKPGGTTPDGQFTLEEVECIGLCGNAPCLTVNWRFFGDVTDDDFDGLVDDLSAGRLASTVPPHGTLCRVRRSVGLMAGVASDGTAPKAGAGGAAGQPATAKGTPEQGGELGSKRDARRSARQAAEVEKQGDSAPEPGSGERR
jgi:NADH-quinone oxidoreductase subunit E